MSKKFKIVTGSITVALLISYFIYWILLEPVKTTWGEDPGMYVVTCSYHGVWIEQLHIKYVFSKECMNI